MDVHVSRDGRVMVNHDDDTQRTAGVSHVIAATDSGVLRTLDVGRWRGEVFAGEQMPFLEEVLATVPAHGRALVEIKSGPAIASALAAALQRIPEARLYIDLISFDLDALLSCRAELPDLPCYLVTECTSPGTPHDPALIELACRHGLTGLDPECVGITPAFAAAARRAGLRLLTWTINDPVEAARLAALALDAITTDYPLELRQSLAG